MSEHHEDHSLAHSMTDLMTSLAIIFVLLLIVFLDQTYKRTEEGSQNRLAALKDALNKELDSREIRCEETTDPQTGQKDPLSCTIRLRDDNLQFGFNSARLAPKGQELLSWMTPRLTGVLCDKKFKSGIESVTIQGFTDDKGNDNVNLRLSAERAFQVLSYGLDKAALPHDDRECLLSFASTSGRGKRDPIRIGEKINQTASRRVELKVHIKSFEQTREQEG